MLINKQKKASILNSISPSMKGFILTGVVFIASNLGFHSMIQTQFNDDFDRFNNAQSINQLEIKKQELQKAKDLNNQNILQLQEDMKKEGKTFFYPGEKIVVPILTPNNTSKANDFLSSLVIIHEKMPSIDWSNETLVESASKKFLPFSFQSDFMEHYQKFDPAYLAQVVSAQEEFERFNHQFDFNLNKFLTKNRDVFNHPNMVRQELIDKFKQSNQYIDANEEVFLNSLKVLNAYHDKFLNLDHDYNRHFLYSFPMQMALLLASFAFSFLFWLNFPDNKDIQYFKRKSHYKISKKFFYCMSNPSRQVVKQCYKQIEKKANIPQNFLTIQGLKYVIHSIKTNGLDIRLHYFKLKKEKLSLVDKIYLLVPFIAFAGIINYRELNVFDFAIFLCVIIIYVCLSIQSTRIEDIKHYITANYEELNQQYPEFLLKLFMGDVDCKTVEYINFSKKKHCSIDLCTVLEEKQENYLSFLKSQLEQKKSIISQKTGKFLNEKVSKM